MREQALILVGALIVTAVIILAWEIGPDIIGGFLRIFG